MNKHLEQLAVIMAYATKQFGLDRNYRIEFSDSAPTAYVYDDFGDVAKVSIEDEKIVARKYYA